MNHSYINKNHIKYCGESIYICIKIPYFNKLSDSEKLKIVLDMRYTHLDGCMCKYVYDVYKYRETFRVWIGHAVVTNCVVVIQAWDYVSLSAEFSYFIPTFQLFQWNVSLPIYHLDYFWLTFPGSTSFWPKEYNVSYF